jgi:hypothetical protein
MKRLRDRARREGVSVAELVRRSVDQWLDEGAEQRSRQYERAAALVGAFADRDRARDVSRRHDHYLDESYE